MVVSNDWAEKSGDNPGQEVQVKITVKASEPSVHKFPDPLDCPHPRHRLSIGTEESPQPRTPVLCSCSYEDQDLRLGSADDIADGTDGPQIGRVHDESHQLVSFFFYGLNLSLRLKPP